MGTTTKQQLILQTPTDIQCAAAAAAGLAGGLWVARYSGVDSR